MILAHLIIQGGLVDDEWFVVLQLGRKLHYRRAAHTILQQELHVVTLQRREVALTQLHVGMLVPHRFYVEVQLTPKCRTQETLVDALQHLNVVPSKPLTYIRSMIINTYDGISLQSHKELIVLRLTQLLWYLLSTGWHNNSLIVVVVVVEVETSQILLGGGWGSCLLEANKRQTIASPVERVDQVRRLHGVTVDGLQPTLSLYRTQ